uniref:thioredoxin n=1 Tax=Prevotella sp. TaxID=59823 RepID=UPI003FEEE2CA
MKKIILAAVLFLPFLVSCSQNRKAPAVSPQTAEEKSEKTETAKVQYLTTSDFRKKIMDYEAHPDEWVFAGSRPAVIDFYTTWCGPCKMMAPVVESLAGKYAGKVDFYKVDIDQESELASVFGISSIPTFLFIPVKGKPSVQMGAMQKEDFEERIDKIKIK